MSLAASSLAEICQAIAVYVGGELKNNGDDVQVAIGRPADVEPPAAGTHRLNLFFYRFEPAGFDPDTLPGETWFVRTHCLATPFSSPESNTVGEGENELRIIGEVLRLFHETPVFKLKVKEEPYHIQAIFENLGLEQINQLWSTQTEVAYRPSVAYEISLVPIVPNKPYAGHPLVGAMGHEVIDSGTEPPAAIAARTPEVGVTKVDPAREDWAPAICLVVNGVCQASVSLALGSAELTGFTPHVWVAAAAGEQVELQWEVWDAVKGWRTLEAGDPVTPDSQSIDPDLVGSATTIAAPLPFTDVKGQAVLSAVRTYQRAADGAEVEVRSNRVLVSLYEESE